MTAGAERSLPARALAFLKSRRLAIWLIGVLGVYMFLGTLVAQGAPGNPEVISWASRHPGLEPIVRLTGFHAAYATPLFLGLVAFLFASTVLCAWERSKAALTDLRGLGKASTSRLERLKKAPARPIRPGLGDPLETIASRLRRPGTVVRRGPRLAHVTIGAAGPVGSAVFHIALALLFATVGLGQLTRAEGFAGAVVGGPASSLVVSRLKQGEAGALHFDRYGDLSLRVSRFSTDFRSGGVDYRETPYVELVRGKQVLAGQWVHPNAPLRHGSLLVHRSGHGLGVVLTASDPTSGSSATEAFLLDFDASSPGGIKTGTLSISLVPDSPATEASVTVELPVRDGRLVPTLAEDPRAVVSFSSTEASSPVELKLAAGESAEIPGGARLKVDRIDYYSRLSVVDDPSVYPIYLLFALAAAGLSIAILMPFGQAWFLVTGEGEHRRLHVVVSARRAGPLFAERVEEAVRSVTAPDTGKARDE